MSRPRVFVAIQFTTGGITIVSTRCTALRIAGIGRARANSRRVPFLDASSSLRSREVGSIFFLRRVHETARLAFRTRAFRTRDVDPVNPDLLSGRRGKNGEPSAKNCGVASRRSFLCSETSTSLHECSLTLVPRARDTTDMTYASHDSVGYVI